LQATTKHSQFKDVALAVQELAAAEEEGKTLLLQDQQKAQLKSMVAANKLAMDTMFYRMNALIAGMASQRTRSLPHLLTATQAAHPAPQTASESDAGTAENSFFTSRQAATRSRPMQTSDTQDINCPRAPLCQSDRDWGR
jgi:hypothetical protein